MAAKTAARSHDFSRRFWSMLSYTWSELCVIILLHVASASSYAAARLARVSRLKAPCTLCSRLDHILQGKAWFSADLVCAAHRSEISSLAYCKSHSKLAHSDDLCKRCLPAGAGDDRPGSKSRRLCSCCSEPFKKARNHAALSKVEPEQVPADHFNHFKERSRFTHRRSKSFVAGIEEAGESTGGSPRSLKRDGSPRTNEQSTKDSAKPALSRIFVERSSSLKNSYASRGNLPSPSFKKNLLSPRPSEIISARDNNSTTQEDVKAFLSQMSSVVREGSTSPSSKKGSTSPESNGTPMRPYLERHNSLLEPLDGGEASGESSPENLKRQLDSHKKSMGALYKELDEERSASAEAASQAMAMINRLQEEKAALKMEAMQYLRMMEEQADHDHEDIQNLHDLLTERETELLDMEAELDNCRRLLEQEPSNDGKLETVDNTSRNDRNRSSEVSNSSDFVKSAVSGFESETAYIMEALSRLEEKLRTSTNRRASDDAKQNQEGASFEDQTEAESTSVPHVAEENHTDECSCSRSDGDKDGLSSLHTRLRALEDDQEFLKQVLSCLRCGTDGLQYVQEITRHLQELRRVVAQ